MGVKTSYIDLFVVKNIYTYGGNNKMVYRAQTVYLQRRGLRDREMSSHKYFKFKSSVPLVTK